MDLSPYINDAKKIQAETGIPASIILGQMKLESSGSYNGMSALAYFHNNLFGVKGSGTAGSVYMPTREVVNGKSITVNAAFRKYNSAYESMLDHAKLLQNDRYAKHLKTATSVEDFAKGIKAGGYATDPSYVDKLLGVIRGNNLHQYDDPNIKFNPDATLGDNNGATVAPQQAQSTQGFIQGTVRALLIVGVMILAVVFFIKAFPAVGGAIDKVTPTGKAKMAIKGVKAIAAK